MLSQRVLQKSIMRLGLAVRRRASIALLGALAALLACVPGVAQFAYVPNGADRTVSVIDTASNTVVTTIALPETDLFPVGVAVNPSGTRVYVTNACEEDFLFGTGGCAIGGPGSVSVINVTTNTLIATIPIPNEPVGVAVTQDGSRVYVVNGCGDCLGSATAGSVSVINAATNMVVATIPLTDLFSTGIAVNQSGSRLYVANLESSGAPPGTVSVIDTGTSSVTTINTNVSPVGLVLNPKRPRLYVAGLDGTLSVIDTTTNTVTKTIATAGFIGLAIKPDGTRLYAASIDPNPTGIAVIDTTDDNLNVVATASTDPILPVGLTVHPDGSRVYVTSFEDGKVLVIDTATNLVSSTVTVGTSPTAFGQFIAPGTCPGANISAYLTSGPAAPVAGGTYTWTVKFEVYACPAVTNLKVQGGTNGWTSPASVGLPSVGTTSTKVNNKNQVITWSIPSLTAGQTATLTLTIQGTVKAGTPSGTVLGLTGVWSAGSATAGPINVTVH